MSPTGNFRRVAIVMAALSVPVVSRSAAAQWAVKATGPNVFGNERVIALVPSGSGDALIIQGNQKNLLYIALIEHGTSRELNQLPEMPSGIPAELFVKVDQDAVQKFDARLRTPRPEARESTPFPDAAQKRNSVVKVAWGRIPHLMPAPRIPGADPGSRHSLRACTSRHGALGYM